MPAINFASQSYQARSKKLNSQRLVNGYLQPAPKDSKAPAVLCGTPGLRRFVTVGDGPIYGLHKLGSLIYVVSGDSVYTVSSAGAVTLLDTIGTVSDVVIMDDNGTYVVIVKEDGAAYYANASGITQITDGDFESASSVTVLDGYGIFTRKDTNEYAISGINDITTYDALEYAFANQSSGTLVRGIANHGELWLYLDNLTEVHYDTANADFPFVPNKSATMQRGCAAKRSIAKEDNTLFWLADDRVVYRANAYNPQRISTYAIEDAIAGYTTISDAEAFCYTQAGHKFYVLTFPTELVTWVYDITTGLWHQRQSFEKGRWRATSFVFAFDKNLVGDFENGKIYEMRNDVYDEDGDILQLIAVCPPIFEEQKRITHDYLWVDFDTGEYPLSGQGSAPVAMLRFSGDGGSNWSNERTETMGVTGEYGVRVKWTNLGQDRERIYELNITDPIPRKITGAYAGVRVGNA